LDSNKILQGYFWQAALMNRYFRILSVVLVSHAPLSSALAAGGRDPAITKDSDARLKDFRDHPDHSIIEKPGRPDPARPSRPDIMRRDNQAIQKGTETNNERERLHWLIEQAADAVTRNPRDHSNELEKGIKAIRDYLGKCAKCEEDRQIDDAVLTKDILDAAQKKILNPSILEDMEVEPGVSAEDPRCTLEPSPANPQNPFAARTVCPPGAKPPSPP
jgi:hypothetical protein